MRFHARVAIGNIAEGLTRVRLLVNYLFWVDIRRTVWYNVYILWYIPLLILHVGLGGCRYMFEFTVIPLFLVCDVHICFELFESVQIMPNPLRKIFVVY